MEREDGKRIPCREDDMINLARLLKECLDIGLERAFLPEIARVAGDLLLLGRIGGGEALDGLFNA